MALPSSGPLSLLQIANEFGTARNLAANYGKAAGVPASGTISIGHFYGKSNIFIINVNANTALRNARAYAVSAGWNGTAPLVFNLNAALINTFDTGTTAYPGGLTVNIAAGTLVGGSADGGTAFRAFVPVTVNNLGKIWAAGGRGGLGGRAVVYYLNDQSNAFRAEGGRGGAGEGFYALDGLSVNPPAGGEIGDYNVYSGGVLGGHTKPWAQGGAGGTGGSWGNAGGRGGDSSIGGSYGGNSNAGAGFDGSPNYYMTGGNFVTWVAYGNRAGLHYGPAI